MHPTSLPSFCTTPILQHKHIYLIPINKIKPPLNITTKKHFQNHQTQKHKLPLFSLLPPTPTHPSHNPAPTNMSFAASFKASLSQSLNWEGIKATLLVISKHQHLALPHITVKDTRYLDWVELEKRGFKGVVFDKDNTLTAPYSLNVWPLLSDSLDECKRVFGANIVVFSNSAGLSQYDPDGLKAKAVEDAIGIHVIRHGVKKPDGTAADIEKYFGCPTSSLIMVGDRHFTDVVYGNRNGFLTVLTEPLTSAREPFVVKQIRTLEAAFANFCLSRGLKPKNHTLLSEAMQCLKSPIFL